MVRLGSSRRGRGQPQKPEDFVVALLISAVTDLQIWLGKFPVKSGPLNLRQLSSAGKTRLTISVEEILPQVEKFKYLECSGNVHERGGPGADLGQTDFLWLKLTQLILTISHHCILEQLVGTLLVLCNMEMVYCALGLFWPAKQSVAGVQQL